MFKKILLPVDGSPCSLLAVDHAVVMAKAFDAQICVVTVVDPYPFSSVSPDHARGRTHYLAAARQVAADAHKTACQMIEAKGLFAHTFTIEAHLVWKGILEVADSVNADLLVMGFHGRNGLHRWVLGSVTHQLLQHASIPVLVVHDTQQPKPPKGRNVWQRVRVKSEYLAHSHRRP